MLKMFSGIVDAREDKCLTDSLVTTEFNDWFRKHGDEIDHYELQTTSTPMKSEPSHLNVWWSKCHVILTVDYTTKSGKRLP